MDLLTINKKDPNADEEKGPSVDSENIEERIQARRLRIKKKNELNLKKSKGSVDALEGEKKKEPTKGRKQIQDSRARLVKLEKDGLELVTNIRVAGDAREHARRVEEEELIRSRKEKLEQEAKAATEKFEEIVKKWETANSKWIPQELHELLMDQKHLCDSMVDEKNKILNEFKFELKQKDDALVKSLKRFGDDIDLLIERMKDQFFNMRKFYLDEMSNVESAFVSERKELLDKHRREWDERMEERRHKEVAFLDARFRRVELNEHELNEMRIKYSEEYNEVKIKLETDIQSIELQTQQAKALYQLNQEKLEYNYQVLQKRDEENAKTKAQQKRKITKLQDTQTNLKKKLVKQIKQLNDENQQLADEYKRVTDMFNDLKMKSKHFLMTDLKKFNDIWKMNEEECKALSRNLLDADRIIFEQQLGIEFKPPDLSFMENVGPLNGANKLKSGQEFVTNLFDSEGSDNDDDDDDNEQEREEEEEAGQEEREREGESQNDEKALEVATTSTSSKKEKSAAFKEDSQKILLNLSKPTLRKIVMLICDEAGFLLEQKLVNLLQPLEKNEQSMVKLDSIFKSLGIETENDVRLLAQYFVNHRQFKELLKSSTKKNNSSSTSKSGDSGGSKSEDNGSDRTARGAATTDEPIELIHPNEVLTAIKTFLSFHRKQESKQNMAKFRLANLDNRDDTADSEYWRRYKELIDEKKEKLWDALLYSLDKYHSVLNKRAQLIEENKALENQNMEFRMLLAQYLQSNVNQELHIPPTKIPQFEI